jgi:hypothetical protein
MKINPEFVTGAKAIEDCAIYDNGKYIGKANIVIPPINEESEHIYFTAPIPAKYIEFVLEFDAKCLEALFDGRVVDQED